METKINFFLLEFWRKRRKKDQKQSFSNKGGEGEETKKLTSFSRIWKHRKIGINF
jgi:hypothetical protein